MKYELIQQNASAPAVAHAVLSRNVLICPMQLDSDRLWVEVSPLNNQVDPGWYMLTNLVFIF